MERGAPPPVAAWGGGQEVDVCLEGVGGVDQLAAFGSGEGFEALQAEAGAAAEPGGEWLAAAQAVFELRHRTTRPSREAAGQPAVSPLAAARYRSRFPPVSRLAAG